MMTMAKNGFKRMEKLFIGLVEKCFIEDAFTGNLHNESTHCYALEKATYMPRHSQNILHFPQFQVADGYFLKIVFKK